MKILQKIKDKVSPYYNYINQHNSTESQINWWNSDFKNNWIYNFIKFRIKENINSYQLISVFGPIFLTKINDSRKKIFFSGENLYLDKYRYYLKNRYIYDLALDFCPNTQDINHLRFPLWYMYLFNPDISDIKIKEKLNYINNTRIEKNSQTCLVSSWDPNGIRQEIYNNIQKIHRIDSAGNFLNNSNILKDKYLNNKIEYMKNFKFNICPENSNNDGYVTEKIFEAFLSDCIPIYWGGGNYKEPDIIEESSYLYWNQYADNSSNLEIIQELSESYAKFKKFKSERKIFKVNAHYVMAEKLDLLESRLRTILNT